MNKKLKLIRAAEGASYSEKEIQTTFEAQLDDFESGLRYVASFLNTNVGVIDTLAIDEEGRPVIFEFKKSDGSSQDAVIQGLDYASWGRTNFSFLEKTIHAKIADEVVSRDIRIVIVANNFDDRLKRAAFAIEFETMLVSYQFFEAAQEVWVLPSVEVDTSIGGRAEVAPPKSKDQHFVGLPNSMVELYERLEKEGRELGGDVEVNYQPQDYIAFRNTAKAFVWVHPKKKWIRLDLPLTSDEAKSKDYVWKEEWNSGYFHLTEGSLTEGLRLMRVAYEKFETK